MQEESTTSILVDFTELEVVVDSISEDGYKVTREYNISVLL